MTTPTDKVRAALELGRNLSRVHDFKNSEAAFIEALSELDGKVLVPVEPTEESLVMGFGTHYRLDTELGREKAVADYRAMIAPYVKGGTE